MFWAARALQTAGRTPGRTTQHMFQTLEGRTLMSAAPLIINGTSGNDTITVTRTNETPFVRYKVSTNGVVKNYSTLTVSQIVINAGAGNDNVTVDAHILTPCVIHGEAGDDNLTGGGGPDRIYGGGGTDLVHGGGGDDILVTVGGGITDFAYGDEGSDSFWIDSEITERVPDATTTERNAGQVHNISTFIGFFNAPISRDLNSPFLLDPLPVEAGATLKNFSNKPLSASTGPTEDDIFQGAVGDCYFVSGLAAVARTCPNRTRQTVCDLGDGTYAVDFHTPAGHEFVRVDGDLWSKNDKPIYAKLGQEDSLWVPIVEKAWAIARRGESSYESIAGGNGSGLEWSAALGGTHIELNTQLFPTPQLYLMMIDSQ